MQLILPPNVRRRQKCTNTCFRQRDRSSTRPVHTPPHSALVKRKAGKAKGEGNAKGARCEHEIRRIPVLTGTTYRRPLQRRRGCPGGRARGSGGRTDSGTRFRPASVRARGLHTASEWWWGRWHARGGGGQPQSNEVNAPAKEFCRQQCPSPQKKQQPTPPPLPPRPLTGAPSLSSSTMARKSPCSWPRR